MNVIDARRKALLERVRDYGGPINEPAVFAQFMAQVMHESGGLRYVREIWGRPRRRRVMRAARTLGTRSPATASGSWAAT